MWMITSKGFISVVADRSDPNRLLVRARSRDDLNEIIAFAESRGIEGVTVADIFEDPSADYRFRVFVPKHAFAELVALITESIDYDNFKNRVAEANPERAYLYSDVWQTLYQIQEK